MARSARVPKYRRHSSGQARVTLNGKDHLLGPYGSPPSREAYDRLIAEWLENRREPPRPEEEVDPLTSAELILAYWKHAEDYYGFKDTIRGDEDCLRHALRVVRQFYGRTAAKEFGSKALKACRQHMIGLGWSRTYINAQVDRVRRMFRWAAEEELFHEAADVFHRLETVTGLRKGKTLARETKKVRPVSQECIDATLPYLSAVVRAMVRFQLLTGCRPAEACMIRLADIDRATNSACWVYRPQRHKTEHLDHDRLILIGPQAQEVLTPYLGDPNAYCFSPAASEAARNGERRRQRRTPLWPSHEKAQSHNRKARPRRAKGECYDVASYRRAIKRACDRAFLPPDALARRQGETAKEWANRLTSDQQAELRRWQKEHRWHPNQLRHTRATELRRHGLDVTKTVLGHSKVETTQIYAEKDLVAAMELIARIG